MYIVQKFDEIFSRHQLDPSDLWCDFDLRFLYWFLHLDDLSIGDRGVLQSPISIVLEFIYVFRSFKVCLMKLGALTLGAYRLIIVISFWFISPFISMECPSLSHLINVSLKSTLSEIIIATLAWFGGLLAWHIFQPFTRNQCFFLSMRWVSCKQQIVGSSFLIQFTKWCLFYGRIMSVNIQC
jgi:hypothetical protein